MRTYRAGDGPVRKLRFTADGATLVCARSGSMHIHEQLYWIDTRTGKQTRTIDLVAAGKTWDSWGEPFADTQIGEVWFSPDGEWVAVQQHIGDPILLHLWSAKKDRWRRIDPADGSCFCIDAAAFSPDSQILVYASGTDGGGTHWLERRRLSTGHRLPPIAFPGYSATDLAFSPDERWLAAPSYGDVYLYEHRRGPVKGPAAKLRLDDEVKACSFRPDSKEIALVNGNDVHFWDGVTSQAQWAGSQGEQIEDLAWSPDGRLLVLAGKGGTVRFWDRAGGREAQRYDWEIGPVSSVAFAPDGMTCAAGGDLGQIVVWDVAD